MSKIIAIGDIHGRDLWKQIIEKNTFDVCVFVGDYFDSFDIETDEQIKNFREIVAFKKEQGDKVVLLLGNHDLHYLLNDPNERYSGFDHFHWVDIQNELLQAMVHEPLILNATVEDGFLFTHAGVTKTWAEANNVDLNDLPYSINELPLPKFKFNHERDKSNCGEHKSQGPMWVRPLSLREDAIDGYTQVVGHTRVLMISPEENLVFIDALDAGQFLIIEDKKMTVGQL